MLINIHVIFFAHRSAITNVTIPKNNSGKIARESNKKTQKNDFGSLGTSPLLTHLSVELPAEVYVQNASNTDGRKTDGRL